MARVLHQPSGAAPEVIATITAIADQLDLAAVTLSIAVTVDGSPVTPSAVAWLVNGAATGIADATAETTTHTPTAGGVHVVTCAVTVDGIVYYAEAESYTVGIVGADGGWWVELLNIDTSTIPAANWLVGSHTLEGANLSFDRPAACTVMGPDGSTGIVFSTSAAAHLSESSRGSPSFSFAPGDLTAAPAIPVGAKLAMMTAWTSAQALGTTFLYMGQALEPASPGSTTDRLVMRQGDRFDGRFAENFEADSGVSAAGPVSTGLSGRPYGMLHIVDVGERIATCRFRVVAPTGPPLFSDLAGDGWTILANDAIAGHIAANPSSYVPDTLRFTVFIGGSAGWSATCTRIGVWARL